MNIIGYVLILAISAFAGYEFYCLIRDIVSKRKVKKDVQIKVDSSSDEVEKKD